DNFEGTATLTSVTQCAHGTVRFAANADVTSPPPYTTLFRSSFTYTVANGGANETATVNVTVTAVSDVTTDALTTAEDTAITANEIGRTHVSTAVTIVASMPSTTVNKGAHGTVGFAANGDVTY